MTTEQFELMAHREGYTLTDTGHGFYWLEKDGEPVFNPHPNPLIGLSGETRAFSPYELFMFLDSR